MSSSGSAQYDLAAFCLAQDRQAAFLCTNDVLTKDAANTSCLAAVLKASGNKAVTVVYDDNAQFYPEVSAAAIALGVDYGLKDSALTLLRTFKAVLAPMPLTVMRSLKRSSSGLVAKP